METILRRPARPSFVLPPPSWRAPRLLLPLLAALLPAAPPLPLAGQGAWELDQEEIIPSAREKHTMTQSGSKIYLFGGKDAAGNALNDLWAYDLASRDWSQLSPGGTAPPARHSHQAVAVGQSVYVLFGRDGTGASLDDVWRYDRAADAWEQRPSTGSPLPEGRSDFCATTYTSGRILLHGGYTAPDTFADAHVWSYATTTGSWTRRAASPAGPVAETQLVKYIEGGTGEHHDFLYGGTTPTGVSGAVHSYDPAGDAWTELAAAGGVSDPPPARGGAVLAYWSALDNLPVFTILMLAGLEADGTPSDQMRQISVDPATGEIVAVKSLALPDTLSGAAAADSDPNLVGALGAGGAGGYASRGAPWPPALWKSALLAALPAFALAGNGADGAPLSEFLVFGGRVGGFVSAQQASLTVGNVYFPPSVEALPGGQLRVSWPDTILGGVVLQESAALAPGSPWSDVAAAPAHENGRYHLDVDPAAAPGGRRFYRLRSP